MKVLCVSNANGLSPVISGGVVRNLFLLKKILSDNNGLEVICTSGYELICKNYEIEKHVSFKIVRCSLFKKNETKTIERGISYFISLFTACYQVVFHQPKVDLIVTPSDYFCDVIPAFILKLKYRCSVKYIPTIHHICKSPFRRGGNFLVNLLSYLSQRFSFILIRLVADGLVLYQTPEGEKIGKYFISRNFDAKKIFYSLNGIEIQKINSIGSNEKNLNQICFVGGLRASKGIFDLVPIWKILALDHPELKLLIIGHGNEDVKFKILNEIENNSLENSIKLIGGLEFREMIKVIKSSNLFISTSHEEGFGISVAEALACGTKVIAYDLDAFAIFHDYIEVVEKYNIEKFAQKIINPIKEEGENKKNFSNLISTFDWDKILQEEIIFYKKIINNEI